MEFPENEIEELRKIAPDLSFAQEGGHSYILIKNLSLPDGCIPGISDVLLCPQARDGYTSRLFFPVQITGCQERNWNKQLRVLETNWHAFSWKLEGNLRLAEMLLIHLNGLRK
ncbi:MAG: hypothetical protein ABI675_21450 [Chitinophagaceae bacterium]